MIADLVSVDVVVVVLLFKVITFWFKVTGFVISRPLFLLLADDSLERLSLPTLLSLLVDDGWTFAATKLSAISVESFKSVKIAVPATRTPIEEGTALSRT